MEGWKMLAAAMALAAVAGLAGLLLAGGRGTGGGVVSELDVPYGAHEGQKLDAFRVENRTGAPIMVMVHGGGWRSGDKSNFRGAAEDLVQKGFVVITANYRLAPAHVYPVQVEDVACAVAWAAENAERLGGNPRKIVVYGGSAGAHLGAMVAYGQRKEWLEGCEAGKEYGRIIGFIGGSGPYDFESAAPYMDANQRALISGFLGEEKFASGNWSDAEPISYVSAGGPPGLFLAGGSDTLVYPDSSAAMARALNASGIYFELRVFPGEGHDIPGEKAAPEIYWFLDAILG